jgi:hypothetical protein
MSSFIGVVRQDSASDRRKRELCIDGGLILGRVRDYCVHFRGVRCEARTGTGTETTPVSKFVSGGTGLRRLRIVCETAAEHFYSFRNVMRRLRIVSETAAEHFYSFRNVMNSSNL